LIDVLPNETKIYHPSHGKRTRKDKLEKIWNDWKALQNTHLINRILLVMPGFYQTAYLKPHHPAEYMAAV
jgi:hypothetical protein